MLRFMCLQFLSFFLFCCCCFVVCSVLYLLFFFFFFSFVWLFFSLIFLISSSHLGFVHPLQDVALHQCLPSSSVAFLIQVVPSFSVMSSCHLLLGRPLDLFPLLGCHSVHRLVHLLSFNLAIWPAHFHFCFSVYSMILMTFVLFLISEHGILSFSFRSNIFLSIALWAVLSLFVICLFRDHVWQP